MSDPVAKKARPLLTIPRHPNPTFPRVRLFKGLYSPCPTPYDADGKVNLDLIPKMGQKMIDDGVAGIFVNGTMGEAVINSPADRKAILEKWIEFAGPKGSRSLQLIVHVGTENGRACKEMAKHAEEVGADAVACMSPCIFKPKDVSTLVAFLADVATACPKTPFLYYHCTYLTGPTFRCLDILKALDLAAPNMRGCKLTDKDFGDLALCLQYLPDMDIFPAFDNQFLHCAALGADAFVMGGVNIIAPMYLKCWLHVREGNWKAAGEVMARVLDFWERADSQNGGVYTKLCHSIKLLLGLKIGANLGTPCPPIGVMTQSEIDGLLATLREWGWTNWAVTPSE